MYLRCYRIAFTIFVKTKQYGLFRFPTTIPGPTSKWQ
jgi:hypothetical protein